MILASTSGAFESFGAAHLTVMALTVALPVGLSVLVRKVNRLGLTQAICIAFAVTMVLNELISYVHSLCVEGFETFLVESLPLHPCDIAVYLTALVLIKRFQFAYEVAFFWGIGGTLQAIITPSLEHGFPSYYFVRFFITHVGIVAGVLFATWGLKLRPRFSSIFRIFVVSNLYMVFVGIINWLLGSNYMYLCDKPAGPAGGSVFFAAPWPWYLLVLEPVAIAMFLVLYSPFALADLTRRFRRGGKKVT